MGYWVSQMLMLLLQYQKAKALSRSRYFPSNWYKYSFRLHVINAGSTKKHCLLLLPSLKILSCHLLNMQHPWTEEVYAVIGYLLDHGADPSVPFPMYQLSAERTTPLHVAAHDGRSELVLRMVEAGANTSVLNADGMTPLSSAALCDFRLSDDLDAAVTMLYLLSSGAKPAELFGKKFLSATDCVSDVKRGDVISYSWSSTSSVSCPLVCSLLRNITDIGVERALREGVRKAVEEENQAGDERTPDKILQCCKSTTRGNSSSTDNGTSYCCLW